MAPFEEFSQRVFWGDNFFFVSLMLMFLNMMKFEKSCGKIIYVYYSQAMKCQNSE